MSRKVVHPSVAKEGDQGEVASLASTMAGIPNSLVTEVIWFESIIPENQGPAPVSNNALSPQGYLFANG